MTRLFHKLRTHRIAALLCAVSLTLSSCLSNKVETLAENIVRLNFVGGAAPSDQEAFKELMLLAAQETLARGYTFFRLLEWTRGPAPLAAFAPDARANFSVNVAMFRDGEQGSNPVFDARTIMMTQAPQR